MQTKARARPPVRRQSITKLPESGGFDWTVRGGQFIRLIAERKRFHRRRMMEPARRSTGSICQKVTRCRRPNRPGVENGRQRVCVTRETGGWERRGGGGRRGGAAHPRGTCDIETSCRSGTVSRVLCRHACRPRPLQIPQMGKMRTSVRDGIVWALIRHRHPCGISAGRYLALEMRTRRNVITRLLWSRKRSAIALC